MCVLAFFWCATMGARTVGGCEIKKDE